VPLALVKIAELMFDQRGVTIAVSPGSRTPLVSLVPPNRTSASM